MAVQDPVVITCALSGAAASRQQCPHIPFTPEEFAQEASRARGAGASVVHVHARNADTGAPSHDVDDYRAIVDAIRAAVPDVLVSVSTGGPGLPRQDGAAPVRELKPDLAVVAMGSMNYAIYSHDRRKFQLDSVLASPFEEIAYFLQTLKEVGTKPDHECFDAGHVSNLKLLAHRGVVDGNPHVSLVVGVHGGIEATAENLAHLKSLLPAGAHWQVVSVRQAEQWLMLAAALALGGSVRVGFEDNFYTDAGVMASSNGDLVAKAADLCAAVGRSVAEPADARRLLGLSKPAS